MKKRIIAIISFIMALVTCLSITSGCNLVTTNNERDLDQVVATVSLIDGKAPEEIKKKEMVMAYLNYGYYAYQGYSQEAIFTSIINNLVNSRILVQNAMLSFEGEFGDSEIAENVKTALQNVYKNSEKEKYDLERYLTEEDQLEINYNALKSMNDFITGYVEAEEAGVSDTITSTVRTTPSDAAVDTEVSEQEKQQYVQKGIDKGDTDAKRRTAYLKVIDVLKNNELLGNYGGDIKNSIYYQSTLKSLRENKIIEKYENCIKQVERSKVNFQSLVDNYKEMYDAQKDKYDASASDFASALSSASASNPIVYTPQGGYGYVYNLLLGANDIQIAQVASLTDTPELKKEKRRSIYEGITVKDLRGSWILSGYDFDYDVDNDTGYFTGDYTLAKDNPLAFQGEVTKVKDKDEEKGTPAEYRIKEKEFALDEFIDFMETYVYGGVQSAVSTTNADVKKKCEISSAPADYNERIQELLFAFSTDPGSLNTYKGYVISPVPAPGANETYVQEFADAGRELLEMGKNSYIMVATDYGYHVLFYSAKLEQGTGYDNLVAYLNSLDATMGGFNSWQEYYEDMIANWNDEDIDADFYLYQLQKLYSEKMETTVLSEIENGVINKFKTNTSKVNIYKDRYENLISGN